MFTATDPRIAEHLPAARAMARKFVRRMGGMLEFDDLLSIAMTEMWRKAHLYDACRGVTFGQYAKVVMWRRLSNEQKKIWHERRRAWLEQTSISAHDDDDRGIDLPSSLPDPERAYSAFELASAVIGTATGRNRELLRQLCLGETLVDAGDAAGVSKQRAERIQQNAFRVVRRRVERSEARRRSA